ncbi:MAG: ECF transporter S component [Synergistaceae bacterium]|jgi:uncharacterized membrane protein|nr:ECF transporter S component [Synergistaceae bacterium]
MKFDSQGIARVGLLSALGVVAIWIVPRVTLFDGKIYFHLGETIILTSSVLLGRWGGAFVGGVSSALADMLLGFPVWMPFSFVIHGVEGFLAGNIANGAGGIRDVAGMALGVAFMITGYAVAVYFMYGAAAVYLEILGDSVQGLLGIVTAYPFTRFLLKRFPGLKSDY